jgi:hypothetical protein
MARNDLHDHESGSSSLELPYLDPNRGTIGCVNEIV